jgi:hypothetical protein
MCGAIAEHGLDGLVVAGRRVLRLRGAVTYMSGFQIVHRYAYVVVPADGDAFVVFPSEARYVGEHGTALIEQRFDLHPGAAIAAHARDAGWKRIGVYGLDYVMTVRDYRPLEGLDVVPFDLEFDLARSVKSEAELASVRDSVRINRRGFELWAEAYAPGRTAADVMAAAEEYFVAEGCGRLTMNMVLTAPGRSGIAPGVQDRAQGRGARRLRSAVPRDRGARDALGRGLACGGRGEREALGRHEGNGRGLRRVLRGCEDRDARRRELPRRPHGRLEGIRRPRLPPRTRHRPLDRDDDDRVPEGGGGRRHRATGEHGALDAPPCDRQERRGLPYMQDTWLVTEEGGVPLAGLPMEIVVR